MITESSSSECHETIKECWVGTIVAWQFIILMDAVNLLGPYIFELIRKYQRNITFEYWDITTAGFKTGELSIATFHKYFGPKKNESKMI